MRNLFLDSRLPKLPGKDSNLERGNQNPLCYHYTTGYFFAKNRYLLKHLPHPLVVTRPRKVPYDACCRWRQASSKRTW